MLRTELDQQHWQIMQRTIQYLPSSVCEANLFVAEAGAENLPYRIEIVPT